MSRKIILSRKGFDQSSGGKPSFILGDRLINLPIPGSGESGISYKKLYFDEETPLDWVMQQVGIPSYSDCHLDPDLHRPILPKRHRDWKPAFGQAESFESRLKKHDVGIGDIFLFYGWYKAIKYVNGRYQYIQNAPNLHVIYGFLEVDEVYDLGNPSVRVPDFLLYHPHVVYRGTYGGQNRIYVGKNAGLFHFHDSLVLTKKGEKRRSCWELPAFFENEKFGAKVEKEFLPNGNIKFKFSGRNNQELLITSTPEVVAWAKKLVRSVPIQND